MGKEILGSLELNRAYQMDCLEGMKLIPNGSVDMILCDLPYGTTKNAWDSIIPLDKLWEQYERIIKDNGAIVLTCSQPFTTLLNDSNKKLFRYEWIWIKNNSTGFQLANKRPLKRHENISVFYKKQPTYNPQGLIPYGKVNKRGSTGDNWSEMVSNQYVQQWTNYPTQILEFSYDKKKYHPTQKPVALFEYLIKTYTNEGDIILDNCLGSGTTAVASELTKRKWVGFETESKYIEVINKRLDSIWVEDNLEDYK
ncbi:cytosine methyltransferase [Lysinibacillus sphaericus]|uniref:DNA-methyltransferase n=1 Tax=Lysinibacillus sphaericus TaxID=1421 RepID=UPI0018CC9931|nr:site-specific DNA-methyltransferase [Lysinibacillus sphaericus]MBG9689394.1 cytosine methyltransferase [Lysinibacillus sphaericus]